MKKFNLSKKNSAALQSKNFDLRTRLRAADLVVV